jgi:magnesium transporter
MGYFGSTAKVYVSHSFLTSRAYHITDNALALSSVSSRRVYSNACVQSSGRRDQVSLQSIGLRHLSWISKTKNKSVEFNDFSESQEEEAKAAILEKVMKGRQPTDLMLRCE